jgi:aspartyl-tRNA synthetase
MSGFLAKYKKTHNCGELRGRDIGARVVLTGWVDVRRDHGGVVFVDLRDRDGITQVAFDPQVSQAAHALAGDLRNEFCIGIAGEVISRGGNLNPKMPTGEIEIAADAVEIFSRAETPPFPIADASETNEALRLKYRYLDLRRRPLQENFRRRSRIYQTTRRYLDRNRFTEVETPYMVKYTPGGARNFVVPSRLNPGSFYALAESPQIYKQLLMVAGFERYFQITRCFRDEDFRLDRQGEFTQIDIEQSFIAEPDIYALIEGLVVELWRDVLGHELQAPFLHMTYAQAMAAYGVDKPDLRLDLTLCEVTQACEDSGFRVFDAAIAAGAIVKCFRVPDGQRLSRSFLDGLTDFAKPFGIKGVAFARVQADGSWQAPFAKNFKDTARERVNQIAGAGDGDLLLFVADNPKAANACMGAIRLHVGRKLGELREHEWRFMWLTDPPLFEQSEETGAWVSSHHPFTSPKPEHEQYLESDPGRVLARAYDLVLNGIELGGGSIRIHRTELQARVFKALSISDTEARAKFQFLLDAFKYGPPPHGGIALGLDRLAMLMCGAESLRDVIAFPKTQRGTDLMTEAPTRVDAKQLKELYVRVAPELEVKD